MIKKLYDSTPVEFACCVHADCPQAASCLRAVSYKECVNERPSLRIVNPERCTPGADCPHYRPAAPARYALGFKGLAEAMLPRQWRKVKAHLLERYNRNAYYQRRCGKVALSPAEQADIRTWMNEAGVANAPDFDAYTEARNWYD